MAANVLVDAGFVVALLSRRDAHHQWAVAQAPRLAPPWRTCEPVLSEAYHLIGSRGAPALTGMLRRRAILPSFDLADHLEPVLRLMHRYAKVPMSLADACLVRMAETIADPMVLSTDADFGIYRRHGRHVVRCTLPT